MISQMCLFVGLVAVSCSEQMSFDDRIDNLSRVLMSPSLILLWSFADPIHPLVCLYLLSSYLY